MGDFYVHNRQASGCTVVTIGGELDVATAPVLRSHLDELISEGHARLVLDLAALEFLDASGVGVLARAMGRARAQDGWTRLTHASPQVRRVLRITHLAEALPEFPSTAQALSGDRGSTPAHLSPVGGYSSPSNA